MKMVTWLRVAAVAALALMLPAPTLYAQTVLQQPQFVPARTVLDVGNGPTEFKIISGSMGIFTSQSSGVGGTAGGAASATLTLTTTPLTLPCVGCIISGTGITSGTTVSAIVTGSTQLTLSANATIATGTTVSWGAACPAAPPTAGVALIQAGVGGDFPMYTQARVCTYGGTGPGGQFLTFAIGAH